MQSFSDHLRAAARDYYERDAHPVVAWDILGAKTWGDRCMRWAEACEGMTHAEGVAYLQDVRDRRNIDEATSIGIMVSIDIVSHIGRLIDPFDKDPRGFILRRRPGHLESPEAESYTRYIGVNSPQGWLRKGSRPKHAAGPFAWDHSEDPVAWAARKAAWFAQYEPSLPVTDDLHLSEPYKFYPILGRAGDFAKGEQP